MAYKRKSYRGRSSIRKKSYRRSYKKTSMARKRLVRTIKRVALKTAESKFKDTPIGIQQLYHNTCNYIQLNQSGYMPTAGGSQNQRVGDQINVSGFAYKMLIGQKSDRPNVTFRWWFVKVPKGSGYTYGNWFRAATNNVLLDHINNDFVKVLKTGIWRPNEAGLGDASGKEYTFTHSLWCPYKKILKFGPGDGATTHNDDDIYFMIAPYDAYGSLTTDNIAYYQAGLTIYYRDP